MLRFRHIAPAGTEITLSDLFFWIMDALTGRDRTESLKTAIKEKYKVKHCFMMASARAALAMLFSMLKNTENNPEKNEIILPAYTCYSVPAAAEIAGLKVKICDIDKKTLGYDTEQLKKMDFSKVIALVSANLFGNPDDLELIENITKAHNVIFIDDAAQAMNARLGERFAGTFGNIGVYSLDKGKNITSIQGGIIITNDDHMAKLIQQEISNLPWPNFDQKLSEILKIIIYSTLLKPWLYWIPANIPALGLGKTIYTTDYLFYRYSRHLSSIALRLFNRIDNLTKKRCENAKKILVVFKSLKGIRYFHILDNAKPACLRLSILIEDSDKRDRVLLELMNNGIGASISYPKSIDQLDEIKTFIAEGSETIKSGKFVAQHILTLPTMTLMKKKDMAIIKKIFLKHFSD